MRNTKYVAILLAVLMLLTIAVGCATSSTTTPPATSGQTPDSNETPSASEPQTKDEAPAVADYKDGTYEGTRDAGIHPGLKVSVVIKDGKIAEVNVIEHNETEGIGSVALEKLSEAIVEAQSTEVDSVTGASLSSAAIKEAVNKALALASN